MALALAVRLVFFVSAASRSPDRALFEMPPDSGEYLALARSIANGHGFTTERDGRYQPDFRRTPIYPLLVAPVFLVTSSSSPSSLLIAVAMNLLVSVGTVALTCALAARVAGRRVATIAGLLLALDITSAVYANLLLTEATFTALLLGAAWVVVGAPGVAIVRAGTSRCAGSWSAASAGALLGVAALCRPIGLFLGAAVTPAVIAREWRVSGPAVLCRVLSLNAAFTVVIGLWIIRNAVTFDVASLSPIGAVNLYFHRAAYVQARVEGTSVGLVRERWEKAFEERSARWTEPEKMTWLGQEARRIIAAHPGAYLTTTAGGLRRMFGPERDHVGAMLGVAAGGRWHSVVLAMSWLQLGLIYVLATGGAVRGLRRRPARATTVLMLGLIGYFVAMAGPEVYARFRVPLMPPLALLASFAFLPRRK